MSEYMRDSSQAFEQDYRHGVHLVPFSMREFNACVCATNQQAINEANRELNQAPHAEEMATNNFKVREVLFDNAFTLLDRIVDNKGDNEAVESYQETLDCILDRIDDLFKNDGISRHNTTVSQRLDWGLSYHTAIHNSVETNLVAPCANRAFTQSND